MRPVLLLPVLAKLAVSSQTEDQANAAADAALAARFSDGGIGDQVATALSAAFKETADDTKYAMQFPEKLLQKLARDIFTEHELIQKVSSGKEKLKAALSLMTSYHNHLAALDPADRDVLAVAKLPTKAMTAFKGLNGAMYHEVLAAVNQKRLIDECNKHEKCSVKSASAPPIQLRHHDKAAPSSLVQTKMSRDHDHKFGGLLDLPGLDNDDDVPTIPPAPILEFNVVPDLEKSDDDSYLSRAAATGERPPSFEQLAEQNADMTKEMNAHFKAETWANEHRHHLSGGPKLDYGVSELDYGGGVAPAESFEDLGLVQPADPGADPETPVELREYAEKAMGHPELDAMQGPLETAASADFSSSLLQTGGHPSRSEPMEDPEYLQSKLEEAQKRGSSEIEVTLKPHKDGELDRLSMGGRLAGSKWAKLAEKVPDKQTVHSAYDALTAEEWRQKASRDRAQEDVDEQHEQEDSFDLPEAQQRDGMPDYAGLVDVQENELEDKVKEYRKKLPKGLQDASLATLKADIADKNAALKDFVGMNPGRYANAVSPAELQKELDRGTGFES